MTRFRGNWDTSQRRSLRRVLVVGAGRAGVAAAEELRRQGFGGEIQIMCDEPDAPYDRPSCSKGLLTGHKRPADAKLPMQDGLAIQWLMGRKAAHLDPQKRIVTADTDEEFGYDGLVIATGARPVWPKGWPAKNEPGLYTLHGLSDAWNLRKALHRAKRVVVVGGGLTGCEVAYSVRSMARKCVLVDSKQHVMVRALGEVVGGYVTEEVARDGVELRLRRRVSAVERAAKGWVVVLDDGSELETDVVVATVGERPDTKWLADSGFDISDGVLCDENLRVVGGEDVVACGTVARWPNLRYSSKPRRVGQWIMALEQGRAAAAALMGSDHPSRPAALVPRYWSEQFGLRIQVCGDITADHNTEVTVEARKPGSKATARNGVLVNYFRRGEQVGVAAVNMARPFTTIAREILTAPARLAEPPELSAPGTGRRSAQSRMIEAAPAEPPAGRHTIDVPASDVRDLSYEPYPPTYPGGAPAYAPVARRELAAAPAPPPPPAGPGYDPRYEPAYAAGYQQPPGYGYEQYGPGYAPPSYGPPGYGPPGYGPPGYPPPGYDPSQYPPAYSPPAGYGPGDYPANGQPPPGYYPPGYAQPGYAPHGHPPPGYPPEHYGQPGYHHPGYGPGEYAPAPPPQYDPQYPPVAYSPPDYGAPQYPSGEYTPAGYGGPGHPEAAPGYPDPGQPGPGPGYPGPAGRGGDPGWQPHPDYPISPAVDAAPPSARPVSPASRPSNPRDRFTSEFAAIR